MASQLLGDVAYLGHLYPNDGEDRARRNLIATAGTLIQALETPDDQMARIGGEEPSRIAVLWTALELGLAC